MQSLLYERALAGSRGRYVSPWSTHSRIQKRMLEENAPVTQEILQAGYCFDHEGFEALSRQGDLVLASIGDDNLHAFTINDAITLDDKDRYNDHTFHQFCSTPTAHVGFSGCVSAIDSTTIGERRLFYVLNYDCVHHSSLFTVEFSPRFPRPQFEDPPSELDNPNASAFMGRKITPIMETESAYADFSCTPKLRVCNDPSTVLCTRNEWILHSMDVVHESSAEIFVSLDQQDRILSLECDPTNGSLCFIGTAAGLIYEIDIREHYSSNSNAEFALKIKDASKYKQSFPEISIREYSDEADLPGDCTALQRCGEFQLLSAHNNSHRESYIHVWDLRKNTLPVAATKLEIPHMYSNAVIRTVHGIPLIGIFYALYEELCFSLHNGRDLSTLINMRCSHCSPGTLLEDFSTAVWNVDERIDFFANAQLYSMVLPGLGG